MLPAPIVTSQLGDSHGDCSAVSPRYISNISNVLEQNSSCQSEWQAVVYRKGCRCVLTFSEATDRLMLAEEPLGSKLKRKVLFDISMRTVLNMETSDERAVRELQYGWHRKPRMLQIKNKPVEDHLSVRSLREKLLNFSFCSHFLTNQEIRLVQSTAFRSSNSRYRAFECLQWIVRDDYPECISALERRARCQDQPQSAHYFLYYVVLGTSGVKKSLRTVDFGVLARPHDLDQVKKLQGAVLRRVYGASPKTLEVFISPKSGKGDGERLFREGLRPILELTRHCLRVTVTCRPHECEDFVADLQQPLSANSVVVTVGGDGMVQEVVNGLHRRRLAWIARMRAECATAESASKTTPLTLADGIDEGVALCPAPLSDSAIRGAKTPQKDSSPSSLTPSFDIFLSCGWDALMPLIATVPSGSACGLAKILDVMDLVKAALSLVHLTTCRLSLLSMKFKRNQELFNFHWNRWSEQKRKTITKRFESYCQTYSEEINMRLPSRKSSATFCESFANAKTNNCDENIKNGLDKPSSFHETGLVTPEANAREPFALASFATAASPKGSFSSLDSQPPFFKDGTSLYTDPVSYSLGAPEFQERVAFMSLSFGMPNDIDRGSEPLRWLGNARFALFGTFLLLSGVRKYKATIRYLPWVSNEGYRLESFDGSGALSLFLRFSSCTMRDNCPNCQKYAKPRLSSVGWLEQPQCEALNGAHNSPKNLSNGSAATADCDAEKGGGKKVAPVFLKSAVGIPEMEINLPPTATSAQRRLLMSCSDADLLQEDQVDFEDESLPWETVSGDFVAIVLCNVCNLARDIVMAPFSHLSDGAIDIVFYRSSDQNGSKSRATRKDVLGFFIGTENGTHIRQQSTSYVKARAIEIKVDSGISMSDGEMMPLSSVRVTKIRDAVRIVRSD